MRIQNNQQQGAVSAGGLSGKGGFGINRKKNKKNKKNKRKNKLRFEQPIGRLRRPSGPGVPQTHSPRPSLRDAATAGHRAAFN